MRTLEGDMTPRRYYLVIAAGIATAFGWLCLGCMIEGPVKWRLGTVEHPIASGQIEMNYSTPSDVDAVFDKALKVLDD